MEVMPSAPTTLRSVYKEQGFVIAKGLIPEPVTNRVLADLEMAAAQALKSRGCNDRDWGDASLQDKLRRVLDEDVNLYLSILRLGSRLQSVYALTLHERILSAVADLGCKVFALPCGVAIHLIASDLKVPGGYFGWAPHQDWSSSQGSLDQLALWIPLMDVDKEFYPLEVIPGSHKRGVLPGDRKGANPRGALITIDPGLVEENDFIPVELDRGDVIIFSGLLVHRTGLGSRNGLRIACGSRFDNVQDPTFVERNYPCAFRLHAETDVLHPGFPTPDQVRQLFQ
jgi:hypothetical protein